jgi:hypothetical protein
MFPALCSVTLTMTGANQRKGVVRVERLRKPGTLLVVAVVCLASAAGNGLYDDDFSNLATIVFSVLGSLFLAAAIVQAARAHGATPPRVERDPARDRAERARRLQEELRQADRPNLTGNMGPGGAGPGTG